MEITTTNIILIALMHIHHIVVIRVDIQAIMGIEDFLISVDLATMELAMQVIQVTMITKVTRVYMDMVTHTSTEV